MSGRFKASCANTLSLGVYLSHMLGRYLDSFRLYEQDKEKPVFTDQFLADFDRSLQGLKAAGGQQSTSRMLKADAHVSESEARRALYDTLIGIRDDVRIYHPKNRPLQRAFCVGRKLPVKSTPQLLAAAAVVIESWKAPQFQPLAEAAGVSAARIDTVAAQHARLSAADVNRNQEIVDGVERTTNKVATLAHVSATNSTIRRVARRVFRQHPAILAKFLANPEGTTAPTAKKSEPEPTEPASAEDAESEATAKNPGELKPHPSSPPLLATPVAS